MAPPPNPRASISSAQEGSRKKSPFNDSSTIPSSTGKGFSQKVDFFMCAVLFTCAVVAVQSSFAAV